jgi:hypothetical protein
MFDVGQRVIVITEKGLAYDATVLERARGDGEAGAYKVVLNDRGPEQLGQWHRACDVFLPEKSEEQEEQVSMDSFLRK